MTEINGEIFFTQQFPMRMDLKKLNVIDVNQIDFILVSSYRDLYALPYLA